MPREKSPSTPTVRKRAPRKSAAKPKPEIESVTRFVGLEHRAALIAEAAFFRAEKRGFAPGSEVEDWLAAEAEVDAKLLQGATAGARG
jgi:hypothetical protein